MHMFYVYFVLPYIISTLPAIIRAESGTAMSRSMHQESIPSTRHNIPPIQQTLKLSDFAYDNIDLHAQNNSYNEIVVPTQSIAVIRDDGTREIEHYDSKNELMCIDKIKLQYDTTHQAILYTSKSDGRILHIEPVTIVFADGNIQFRRDNDSLLICQMSGTILIKNNNQVDIYNDSGELITTLDKPEVSINNNVNIRTLARNSTSNNINTFDNYDSNHITLRSRKKAAINISGSGYAIPKDAEMSIKYNTSAGQLEYYNINNNKLVYIISGVQQLLTPEGAYAYFGPQKQLLFCTRDEIIYNDISKQIEQYSPNAYGGCYVVFKKIKDVKVEFDHNEYFVKFYDAKGYAIHSVKVLPEYYAEKDSDQEGMILYRLLHQKRPVYIEQVKPIFNKNTRNLEYYNSKGNLVYEQPVREGDIGNGWTAYWDKQTNKIVHRVQNITHQNIAQQQYTKQPFESNQVIHHIQDKYSEEWNQLPKNTQIALIQDIGSEKEAQQFFYKYKNDIQKNIDNGFNIRVIDVDKVYSHNNTNELADAFRQYVYSNSTHMHLLHAFGQILLTENGKEFIIHLGDTCIIVCGMYNKWTHSLLCDSEPKHRLNTEIINCISGGQYKIDKANNKIIITPTINITQDPELVDIAPKYISQCRVLELNNQGSFVLFSQDDTAKSTDITACALYTPASCPDGIYRTLSVNTVLNDANDKKIYIIATAAPEYTTNDPNHYSKYYSGKHAIDYLKKMQICNPETLPQSHLFINGLLQKINEFKPENVVVICYDNLLNLNNTIIFPYNKILVSKVLGDSSIRYYKASEQDYQEYCSKYQYVYYANLPDGSKRIVGSNSPSIMSSHIVQSTDNATKLNSSDDQQQIQEKSNSNNGGMFKKFFKSVGNGVKSLFQGVKNNFTGNNDQKNAITQTTTFDGFDLVESEVKVHKVGITTISKSGKKQNIAFMPLNSGSIYKVEIDKIK